MDFGGSKIDLATAGLDGSVLEWKRISTEPERGAEQAVQRALSVGRELINRTILRWGGRCLAAAAVSPGIVASDHVELAPNVPGWEHLALPALVQDGLSLSRVVVGTDVKAATLAEARWGSLRGAEPGVFVGIGTGLGIGIVTGGSVLIGAHGAAGEIGYNLRSPKDALVSGLPHKPLEKTVGGRFLAERATRLLGRETTTQDAFASQDPDVAKLIESSLNELTFHLTNLSITVDPERIALGGGVMASGQKILEGLRERIKISAPFSPDIVVAHFLGREALHGAIVLALDVVGSQQ